MANMHRHSRAVDLRAGLELPENAGVAHANRLAALPATGNPVFL